MSEHILKTWPEYYRAIDDGSKTFEVRLNDRDYRVGDVLNLVEYDPKKDCHLSGRNKRFTVTYILTAEPFVPRGYCIMAIKPIDTKGSPK